MMNLLCASVHGVIPHFYADKLTSICYRARGSRIESCGEAVDWYRRYL